MGEKESFTLLARFLEVVNSPSGRSHLRKTWKFASLQAWRAASGLQISEILSELDNLGSGMGQTLDLPENSSLPRNEFSAIARRLGAGKQTGHEFVYQYLDFDRSAELSILEIGLGTNDPKAPSSMGTNGIPGSSLQMWTSLFPQASVYGADVDEGALVQSDRISSFVVDSTDQASVERLISILKPKVPSGLDLIIDDGLHTPESNLRLLIMLSQLIKPGGYYVIEDVPKVWTGFWRVVGESLHTHYKVRVIDESQSIKGSSTFVVLRKN